MMIWWCPNTYKSHTSVFISSTTTPHNVVFNMKVKWYRFRPGVGRGIALLFHDRGTRRGWVVSRTSPPGKTRYPFYSRLGGSQGRSGRAENLVPTGIRSQTVQTVVTRYTDWATGFNCSVYNKPKVNLRRSLTRHSTSYWRTRTRHFSAEISKFVPS